MRPFYLAAVLVGCHAATVGVAPKDTGGDVATDADDAEAAIDASLILPDGRVCTGPDTDFDTKPDECDECPAVPDQIALGSGSWNQVGSACSSLVPFWDAKHRVRFFDFTEQPDVQQYSDMPFVVRDVPGFSVFESPPPGEDAKLRFVLFNQPVDPSLLVATTYLNLLDNLKTDEHVGILLRGGAVTADGIDFYFCWAGPTSFGLARAPSTGCNGGECALVTMSSDDTSDLVECRVFQAGGGNLQNGSDDYLVRVKVPAASRPPGKKLGLGIMRSQGWFLSLDVHGR